MQVSTGPTVRRPRLGPALELCRRPLRKTVSLSTCGNPRMPRPPRNCRSWCGSSAGASSSGAGPSPSNSGVQFAKQGVILITFNYRVGRFGFFAFPALSKEHPNEPKGNYAYLDQIAALKWTQQNIAAFGGDPNNVTIFGFSAGGVSVHSLLTCQWRTACSKKRSSNQAARVTAC